MMMMMMVIGWLNRLSFNVETMGSNPRQTDHFTRTLNKDLCFTSNSLTFV